MAKACLLQAGGYPERKLAAKRLLSLRENLFAVVGDITNNQ
jgi:hypothetical protein